MSMSLALGPSTYSPFIPGMKIMTSTFWKTTCKEKQNGFQTDSSNGGDRLHALVCMRSVGCQKPLLQEQALRLGKVLLKDLLPSLPR